MPATPPPGVTPLNRIDTPPDLSDLARLFLVERRVERGLKPRTLHDYRVAIDMFLNAPGAPPTAAELTKLHALEWTAALRDRGLSPGGIAAYQRPVWVWFRWLYTNDYCPEDIPRRLSRVAVKDPSRRTVSAVDYRRMVTVAAHAGEMALRNVAIIETLWSAGPRRTELTLLDLDDYDSEAGTLRFRQTKTVPRVSGIGEDARLALERYVLRKRGREPGPLFLDRMGRRMSSGAVRDMLRSTAKLAGVVVSSHDFRRAAASNMLGAWMDPADVARQLGHARVEQTLVYAESTRTARAVRAFHRWDREQKGRRDVG